MNRRNFLQYALPKTGTSPQETSSVKVTPQGDVRLCIGILSDIHIKNEDTKMLQHAFTYFRDQKVDGVLIAGDMADNGLERQLKEVANAWYRIFPKDKAPDGRKVEKLFIYGNHDVHGCHWSNDKYGMTDAEWKKQAIGEHPAETWKRYFKEKYEPIYMKTVKGYHFVGAHWHDNNIPGLDTFLAEHGAELKSDKPFFYFQHPHPKNTCYGADAWGQDDGTVTEVLGHYPNAVAFSGHSHLILNDERDLWQGSFTSIGTSSLSYIWVLEGRENFYEDQSLHGNPCQMNNLNCQLGQQGMLMRVYDNCIVLERKEFAHDQKVGEDWVLPLPLAQDKSLSFEQRKIESVAPQFGKEDKVTTHWGTGKDRYGKEQKQLTVHFPTVLKSKQGIRANDYEVQAEVRFVDVVTIEKTKRVYSAHGFLGEAQDDEGVDCVFGESELPERREIRFAVRPCNCFGKKGQPIYSDWISSRE